MDNKFWGQAVVFNIHYSSQVNNKHNQGYNNLYGCGKASDYQIQPIKYKKNNDLTDKIENPEMILKDEKIIKATGGLKFSLIWCENNRLFAMGDNKFGQCGQNNILNP